MNIDRKLFLALAASLSVVACSGSEEETDAAGGAQSAGTTASNPSDCWDPTTESMSADTQAFFAKDLGFDPVNDFPAAEGFCQTFAFPPGTTFADTIAMGVFEKCNEYAAVYVPHQVYGAFGDMKRNIPATATPTEKLEALYGIDRRLVSDRTVCVTSEARAMCATDENPAGEGDGDGDGDGEGDGDGDGAPAFRGNCAIFASQVNRAHGSKAKACIERSLDVYSCAELGIRLRF